MNLNKPVLTGIGRRQVLVQIRLEKGGRTHAVSSSQLGDGLPEGVNQLGEQGQLGEDQLLGGAHQHGGEEQLGHHCLVGDQDGGYQEFGRGQCGGGKGEFRR